ncbi:MAG: M23 family metallopeptidase [Actinomycetota bacterium]
MADRKEHRSVLRRARAALVAGIVLASMWAAVPAEAHNQWTGAYRKFPWKAGTSRTLGTLPGECPHCSGRESSSAWKAIDVPDMDYETVYSVSPGVVDTYVASSGPAGLYLRIKQPDSTYIVYEHLDSVISTSGTIVAGQPLAVSGKSGSSSYSPHLHFQRQSGTSFSSDALPLTPISGHGTSSDPLERTSYTSDNAGVGYSSADKAASLYWGVYKSGGGYYGVGITADVGEAWSPCREDSLHGTWWRYSCYPKTGTGGSVQTYSYGSYDSPRAIMQQSGESTAYLLLTATLAAYTEQYAGHDWVYWIGYPTSNRYDVGTSSTQRQNFESGYILFYPSTCKESVYQDGVLRATYSFCD